MILVEPCLVGRALNLHLPLECWFCFSVFALGLESVQGEKSGAARDFPCRSRLRTALFLTSRTIKYCCAVYLALFFPFCVYFLIPKMMCVFGFRPESRLLAMIVF